MSSHNTFQELEFKLRLSRHVNLDEKQFASLVGHSGKIKSFLLSNRYYDTPGLELNRRRIALRIRQIAGLEGEGEDGNEGGGKGEKYIQTLKTAGQSLAGLHKRGEWEWNLPQPELDWRVLHESPAWPLDLDADEIQVIFQTDFQRSEIMVVDEGDSSIELVWDEGQVLVPDVGGKKTTPIHELELELKSGDVEAVFNLALKLTEKIPAMPDSISKAQRGYRLFLAPETQGAEAPCQNEVPVPFETVVALVEHLGVQFSRLDGAVDALDYLQAEYLVARSAWDNLGREQVSGIQTGNSEALADLAQKIDTSFALLCDDSNSAGTNVDVARQIEQQRVLAHMAVLLSYYHYLAASS